MISTFLSQRAPFHHGVVTRQRRKSRSPVAPGRFRERYTSTAVPFTASRVMDSSAKSVTAAQATRSWALCSSVSMSEARRLSVIKRDRDREVAGWIESGRDTPSGWIGNRVISPDAVFEERIEAIAVVVGVGIAGEGD